VTIPKGATSASFYYKDLTSGTPTITAIELPGQGWTQGTQQQKVNPALAITTPSLPAGDVGTSYTQNLGSSGGTDTYTWSVSAGTLPTGLVLSGNTISGTPTATGLSIFSVKVADGIDTETKEFSVTIHPALTLTTSLLPAGDPNASYSHTLSLGRQWKLYLVDRQRVPVGGAFT
jgi:hypothetical protein